MSKARGNVLIVNDVPDQLQLMSLIMQQAGYAVSEATDALEGFEVAQQVKPTLIISDVLHASCGWH